MNKIFECIIGSQAYGTNLPTSDVDIKGIYIQPNEDILGFNYKEQIDLDKDTVYYEIKRFIQLASTANPTILEMLFSNQDMIKVNHPCLKVLFDNKKNFLTKNCFNSFSGYAFAQIKRARGLNKKMNWEGQKSERKTPIDFCYVLQGYKSIPLVKYLQSNNMKQEYCGLCAVDHFPSTYVLYYDWPAHYGSDLNKPINPIGYRGIEFEDSNHIRLSSIPKVHADQVITTINYNQDAYSKHCNDYNSYQSWLANRNIDRYVDTTTHGQKIDGKNMMHCIRLIECAEEIATQGTFNVKRSNRDELLSIRKGEVNLEEILNRAEIKLGGLKELFDNSDLSDTIDQEFIHNLVNQIRKDYWV